MPKVQQSIVPTNVQTFKNGPLLKQLFEKSIKKAVSKKPHGNTYIAS